MVFDCEIRDDLKTLDYRISQIEDFWELLQILAYCDGNG